MEQYRNAIHNAAQELPRQYKMSDTLIARIAAACEAEADDPAHYFRMDDLFSEFQEIGPGPSIDDAFGNMMGYAGRKETMNDVSPAARANVLRVIASDGMFPERFYDGLTDQPSAELKTREAIVTALGAYTERGCGSDDAWICNNYGYLRQVLRMARQELGGAKAYATVRTPEATPPQIQGVSIPEDIDAMFNSMF